MNPLWQWHIQHFFIPTEEWGGKKFSSDHPQKNMVVQVVSASRLLQPIIMLIVGHNCHQKGEVKGEIRYFAH